MYFFFYKKSAVVKTHSPAKNHKKMFKHLLLLVKYSFSGDLFSFSTYFQGVNTSSKHLVLWTPNSSFLSVDNTKCLSYPRTQTFDI